MVIGVYLCITKFEGSDIVDISATEAQFSTLLLIDS